MPRGRGAVPVASVAGVIVGVALVAWGQNEAPPGVNGWFAYAPLSRAIFQPALGLRQEGIGATIVVLGLVVLAFWSGRHSVHPSRRKASRRWVAVVVAGLGLILLGVLLVLAAHRGLYLGPLSPDWMIGFGDGAGVFAPTSALSTSQGFAFVGGTDLAEALAGPAFEVGVVLTGLALTTLAFWSGRVTSSAARRDAA